jgi:hypothetical protein
MICIAWGCCGGCCTMCGHDVGCASDNLLWQPCLLDKHGIGLEHGMNLYPLLLLALFQRGSLNGGAGLHV